MAASPPSDGLQKNGTALTIRGDVRSPRPISPSPSGRLLEEPGVTPAAQPTKTASTWAPLRTPTFRLLWSVTLRRQYLCLDERMWPPRG